MYAAIKGRTVFVSHTAVAGLFWFAFMIISALLPVAVPAAVCNNSIHHAIVDAEQNISASNLSLSLNWSCTWNLEAPTDYIIKLTFERKFPYMKTAVNCDQGSFIEIRDGKNTSSQLVKNSCQGHFWNNFPLDKPFYSISNQLSITFSSGTYKFAQIVIRYQAVQPAPSCLSSQSLDSNLNIFVNGSHGNISLPEAAQECLWRVVAPPNHVIKAVFPKLPCPSVLQIMIYDGVYGMSDPAMQPDKSCSLLPPSLETVYSTGRYLSIHVRRFLNTLPVGHYSANISTVMQEQTGLCGVQSKETSRIILEGKEGSIFVPKYGNQYLNWGRNRYCIWTIKVPSNHIIKLQFSRLSNMNEGYLEVKDGLDGSGVKLLRFCDLAFREQVQDFPPPVYTSGQYLQLILNYKVLIASPLPWTGFLAIYQAVSEVPPATPGICSSNNTIALNNDIHLKHSAGSFRSPNYPRKFPRSISCTWKITAPLGKRIRLTFKKGGSVGFKRQDCLFWNMDYLEFRDGITADSSEIRKKYCGNDLPTVVSSGREMSVRLFANCKEDTADYGFEAYYETELTGGTIALIVVLVLLVVVVIVVVLFCVYKKKQRGSLKSSNVSYSKPPDA